MKVTITRETAERNIKSTIAGYKNNVCEFNEGLVVGFLVTYYQAGLFTQDEVNQILSDNGFDTIDFNEQED